VEAHHDLAQVDEQHGEDAVHEGGGLLLGGFRRRLGLPLLRRRLLGLLLGLFLLLLVLRAAQRHILVTFSHA